MRLQRDEYEYTVFIYTDYTCMRKANTVSVFDDLDTLQPRFQRISSKTSEVCVCGGVACRGRHRRAPVQQHMPRAFPRAGRVGQAEGHLRPVACRGRHRRAPVQQHMPRAFPRAGHVGRAEGRLPACRLPREASPCACAKAHATGLSSSGACRSGGRSLGRCRDAQGDTKTEPGDAGERRVCARLRFAGGDAYADGLACGAVLPASLSPAGRGIAACLCKGTSRGPLSSEACRSDGGCRSLAGVGAGASVSVAGRRVLRPEKNNSFDDVAVARVSVGRGRAGSAGASRPACIKHLARKAACISLCAGKRLWFCLS